MQLLCFEQLGGFAQPGPTYASNSEQRHRTEIPISRTICVPYMGPLLILFHDSGPTLRLQFIYVINCVSAVTSPDPDRRRLFDIVGETFQVVI